MSVLFDNDHGRPCLTDQQEWLFQKSHFLPKSKRENQPFRCLLYTGTLIQKSMETFQVLEPSACPGVKPLFTWQGMRPQPHFQAQAQPAVPILGHLWSEAGSLHILGAACLQ